MQRMENYLTLREVAAMLKITTEAVRRLCHRGTLAHVRKGGRMYVRRDVVEARLEWKQLQLGV